MGMESMTTVEPKKETLVDQAVKMEAEIRKLGNDINENERMLEEIRAGERVGVGTSRGPETEENLANWIEQDRNKQSELSRNYQAVLNRVNAGEK